MDTRRLHSRAQVIGDWAKTGLFPTWRKDLEKFSPTICCSRMGGRGRGPEKFVGEGPQRGSRSRRRNSAGTKISNLTFCQILKFSKHVHIFVRSQTNKQNSNLCCVKASSFGNRPLLKCKHRDHLKTNMPELGISASKESWTQESTVFGLFSSGHMSSFTGCVGRLELHRVYCSILVQKKLVGSHICDNVFKCFACQNK